MPSAGNDGGPVSVYRHGGIRAEVSGMIHHDLTCARREMSRQLPRGAPAPVAQQSNRPAAKSDVLAADAH